MDIFEASRKGDLEKVKEFINAGVDLDKKDKYGFTALHQAAMGSNQTDPETNLSIVKLLVDAGAPLETEGGGKRSPLFLLAEFSQSLEQVKYLVEKGANPNVFDEHGNHIVENAMLEEVKEYLSKLTGKKIPTPPPELKKIKLTPQNWKKVKSDLDQIFDALNSKNLIALQNAGYTQGDGFSDCSEVFHESKNKNEITGFCFYTEQDYKRARKEGLLLLGIWGAPNGGEKETIKIGKLVQTEFLQNGYEVDWDESSSTRPTILLGK